MKKRLVLIDFQNFLFRCMHIKGLKSKNENVHVVYGFFKNIIELMKEMEDNGNYECEYVVCHDGGYDKRYELSSNAVKMGIIDKTYKEDRRYKAQFLSEEEKKEKEDNKRQAEIIKQILVFTKIKQAYYQGEEADDIAGSLAKQNEDFYDSVVLVTSDQDYYQLINHKTSIYNSIKKEFIDLKNFQKKYDLDCGEQWIDKGALQGDSGDTIIGLHGCGPIKSISLVKKHKSIENILKFAKEQTKELLLQNNNNLKELCEKVYNKKIKTKIDKLYFQALESEEKLKLAYELKKIHTDLKIDLFGGISDQNRLSIEFENLEFHFKDSDFVKLINKKRLGKMITGLSMFKSTVIKMENNQDFEQKDLF